MLRLLARLDSIDTRWLYLATAMVVALPLFVNIPLRMRMGHEAHGLYDTIENLSPKTSVVVLHSDWDAGVLGECKGQFTAVVDHLMRRHIHFVVVSANPQGPAFSNTVLQRLAEKNHAVYLRDYVQLGYCIPAANATQFILAMSRDFWVEHKIDKDSVKHVPISEIPWLRPVSNFGDVSLVVSFGYNPIFEYVQFGTAVYGTPYAPALASINSTTMYPYLNTGQLRGMLVGARGGAEYEAMLDMPKYDAEQKKKQGPGYADLAYATNVIKSQSWAHLMLIFGAVLGNIGFWARRRVQAREAG